MTANLSAALQNNNVYKNAYVPDSFYTPDAAGGSFDGQGKGGRGGKSAESMDSSQ